MQNHVCRLKTNRNEIKSVVRHEK